MQESIRTRLEATDLSETTKDQLHILMDKQRVHAEAVVNALAAKGSLSVDEAAAIRLLGLKT